MGLAGDAGGIPQLSRAPQYSPKVSNSFFSTGRFVNR